MSDLQLTSLPQTVVVSVVREAGKQFMNKLQHHGIETLKEAGKKALTGGSSEEGFRLTLKNVGSIVMSNDGNEHIVIAADGMTIIEATCSVRDVVQYLKSGTEAAVNAVKNTASATENVIGTIILSGLIGAAICGAAVALFRLARANGEA